MGPEKLQTEIQSPKILQLYNFTNSQTKTLPTTTMPVLVDKNNEMLENFNTIRDILNKPTIDLNELRQLLTRVSQDENIFFITQDIMTKIIYYIIEMAYDELQYEKYQYLEQTLKSVTDIIRSGS